MCKGYVYPHSSDTVQSYVQDNFRTGKPKRKVVGLISDEVIGFLT
jgi:hypothetical protein